MKSLTLTREVLKERQWLDAFIPGLQAHVRVGLNILDAIQLEEETLKFHEKYIMDNKNFSYCVPEQKIKRVNLPVRIHTTTCRKCNFTCHNDCPYSDDRSEANCSAVSGDIAQSVPIAVTGLTTPLFDIVTITTLKRWQRLTMPKRNYTRKLYPESGKQRVVHRNTFVGDCRFEIIAVSKQQST